MATRWRQHLTRRPLSCYRDADDFFPDRMESKDEAALRSLAIVCYLSEIEPLKLTPQGYLIHTSSVKWY